MHPLNKYLSGETGGEILDIGTRFGEFISILIESFQDISSITGIDVSDEALDTAREAFSGDDRVSFVNARAEQLPFPDNSLDTISAANALHHLPDIDRTLNEISRALKPDGMVILAEIVRDDPTPPQLTGLTLHDLGGEMATLVGEAHRPTYTRDGVRAIAHRLGLDITFEEIHLREFIPPDDREKIDDLADRFLNHLADIQNHASYEDFARRAEKARIRAYRTGIQHPVQLILAGKMNVS